MAQQGDRDRRGKGSGGITWREDCQRFQGSLGYVDAAGRKERNYVFGRTERDVERKLDEVRRLVEQGIPPSDERLTVADYMREWLDSTVSVNRDPNTYRSYEQLSRVHIVEALGHQRLARLTVMDVERFLAGKTRSGLSANTVQRIRAVLRAALSHAVKCGVLARNVAALADGPTVRKPKIALLTSAEAVRLLEAARGDRLEALYCVAVAFGLRKGEALGLTWDDIDFDQGTLSVRRQVQRLVAGGLPGPNGGRTRLVVKEPKSDAGVRVIPLLPFARISLERRRDRQRLEERTAGARWRNEHNLVFTTSVGSPIDPRNLSKYFGRLLALAGLHHRRFHDLRHTSAALLIAHGASLHEVKEILGHTQISVTSDFYGHLFIDAKRATVSRLAGVFAGD